ncbi:MAG: hypothetical protein COV44_04125 [Deltaproteobacteria bacterium CG11_big_fil_rev_8_21_14_0_20_45_16]|nr:MAG: hypothetical protein COV44_04125 [Deltaproteobacteria bacterium CG11_big_fil_rev_8_21_14_0_20_45_16]
MSDRNQHLDDRAVASLGTQLKGRRIDLVVSAGIACLETPKLVRELRRYGAEVRVALTPKVTNFVSPLCFEWASGHGVLGELSGAAEHLSHADAVVIAPCTLDFLSKISTGLADSAAATLIQSVLGRRPVLVQPSMHSSLEENPIYQKNLRTLMELPFVKILSAREEESKRKVPDVRETAREICHLINQHYRKDKIGRLLLLMGPTRSYLDDVRYISNYSSGRTGFAIADHFYRWGWTPDIVSGPVSINFPEIWSVGHVENINEIEPVAGELLKKHKYHGIIFAAALLDFEVTSQIEGKRNSKSSWAFELKPTRKLIQHLGKDVPIRVGFKLEFARDSVSLTRLIKEAADKNQCEIVVGNNLEDINETNHPVQIYIRSEGRIMEARNNQELSDILVSTMESLTGRNKKSQKRNAADNPKPSSSAISEA